MNDTFVDSNNLIFYIIIGGFIVALFLLIKSSYKICPEGKVMVIFGMKNRHLPYTLSIGRNYFILPFIHKVMFLDLTPYEKNIRYNIKDTENNNIGLDISFDFGISSNPAILENAVKHLVHLPSERICNLGEDIIADESKKVVKHNIYSKNDPLKIENDVSQAINWKLNEIGLELKNLEIFFS